MMGRADISTTMIYVHHGQIRTPAAHLSALLGRTDALPGRRHALADLQTVRLWITERRAGSSGSRVPRPRCRGRTVSVVSGP
jgi:hypothetical protein